MFCRNGIVVVGAVLVVVEVGRIVAGVVEVLLDRIGRVLVVGRVLAFGRDWRLIFEVGPSAMVGRVEQFAVVAVAEMAVVDMAGQFVALAVAEQSAVVEAR